MEDFSFDYNQQVHLVSFLQGPVVARSRHASRHARAVDSSFTFSGFDASNVKPVPETPLTDDASVAGNKTEISNSVESDTSDAAENEVSSHIEISNTIENEHSNAVETDTSNTIENDDSNKAETDTSSTVENDESNSVETDISNTIENEETNTIEIEPGES
jgi:hypothetical protein